MFMIECEAKCGALVGLSLVIFTCRPIYRIEKSGRMDMIR